MKKTIISFIILIILLSSCTLFTNNPEDKIAEFKLAYDECGLMHNIELSNVYQRFVDANVALNKQVAKDIIDEHFILSTSTENRDIASEITALVMDSHSLAKTDINSEVMDILCDSLDIYSQYAEVFDSIAIILDAQIPIEEKTEKLEGIYLFVDQVCTDSNDREALMNGVSTSIHSLSYWSENLDEWQEVLNPELAKSSVGVIGAFAIIDGAGAVVGALEGIRDTYKGQENRGRIITGRIIGEAAKTSTYAVLAVIFI